MAKKKIPATEQQVSDALDGLRDKRAAIEKRRKTKTQWASSCRLELPGWPTITIQIERDAALLVLAIGTLRRFGEDLTIYSVPAFWDGFTIADWIADLEQRVHWLLGEEVLTNLEEMPLSELRELFRTSFFPLADLKARPPRDKKGREDHFVGMYRDFKALADDLSDLLG